MDFDPASDNEEAGLAVYMNERHHYEIAVVQGEGKRHLLVRRRIGDMTRVVADEELKPGSVALEISADKDTYTFGFAQGGEIKSIASGATRYISTEVAGGFTGAFFALYATGNRT